MVEPEPAKAGQAGGGAKLAAPAAGIVVAVLVIEGQSTSSRATSWSGSTTAWLRRRQTRRGTRWPSPSNRSTGNGNSRSSEAHRRRRSRKREQQLATARAELATAQASIAQVQLASPLDGVVARIHVLPGQTVDVNTVVAEIIDLTRGPVVI